MNNHPRALRGEVGGWSDGATRRNTTFLYSVDERSLSGVGYALTLTLRECPPTAQVWQRLRRAWEMRMHRAGMVRLHWVTEWQRRGVPHLHGVAFFPEAMPEAVAHEAITGAWLDVAARYGAGRRGQFVHTVTGIVGWFQYLSKHAVRGVKHYQRSAENMPPGWKQKTGRMWGKGGEWPVIEGRRLNVDGAGFYAYRRLVRSWRVADARTAVERAGRKDDRAGALRRLQSARGMLRCAEKPLSQVRGVSEWISATANLSLLANVASRGHVIWLDDGTVWAGA